MIEILREKYEVIEQNERVFKIKIHKNSLLEAIYHLSELGFITLSQIACTDWIEDENFLLNYILTTKERNINLMLAVEIKRDNETVTTLSKFYPQAEVMERDIHEMFGIKFIGNETLYDFALENWQDIPPLRREFDTLKYVRENYDFRGGRDDNRDVKVEAKRRREEAKKLKEASDGE